MISLFKNLAESDDVCLSYRKSSLQITLTVATPKHYLITMIIVEKTCMYVYCLTYENVMNTPSLVHLIDSCVLFRYEFTCIIKKLLSDHFQTEGDVLNQKFNCLECNRTKIEDKVQLARHLKFTHGINFEDTARAFIANNVMLEELLVSDQESVKELAAGEDDEPNTATLDKKLQNYFCPFCSKIFASTTRLIFHLNSHGELHTEANYECTICKYKTKLKKNFVVHLQHSHVERTLEDPELTCRSCGHTADDSESLAAHIKSLHCVEQPKKIPQQKKSTVNYDLKKIPVRCPICNKIFSNRYVMQSHYEMHSTQQRYQCDKCSKCYRSKVARRRHAELVHEGILRFVCDNCGEAFATKQHRDTHMRKHTGAKPHVCWLCSKGFRDKSDLKCHMDMHFDVRNFACHICPKRFRKVSHLKTHLSSHEKKKNGRNNSIWLTVDTKTDYGSSTIAQNLNHTVGTRTGLSERTAFWSQMVRTYVYHQEK